MLSVGFDAKRALCNYSGLGSYSRTLINSLIVRKRDCLLDGVSLSIGLYSPNEGENDLRALLLQDSDVVYHYPNTKNKLLQSFWRERFIVNDIIRDNIQVFHGLSNELPYNIAKSGVKSVVTIHDVIFLVHPEWYNKMDVWIYKKKFYNAVRNADKIVAISECTKKDIIRYGKVDENRIEVIYQGYASRFNDVLKDEDIERIKCKYFLPEKYILFVGSIEERKNAILAVKAMEGLGENIHLVLVGKKTTYVDKIDKFSKNHNLANRVHILHNIPDEDLPYLYKMAKIFVYPSIYEGFGISIIEAIKMSLPVIACKGSCLEEAGGESNIYVEKNDVKSMHDAMILLLSDEEKRKEIVDKSQSYIKKFENTNIADKYLSVYFSLAN